MTAIWEDALDKIADGKITATEFKAKQQAWVHQLVTDAKSLSITISNSSPKPAMKKSSIPSTGANKFSNNNSKPAVKTTTAAKNTPSQTKAGGKKCPACGQGQMVEKKAKASGKVFLGCNTWPKCNHVEWPKK